MIKCISAVCAFVLFISLSACNHDAAKAETSFSLDSVKTQIATVNARYGASFASNDSVGFLTCYTSDACINPPNMARICGQQGIGMFFSGGYHAGVRNIRITTEEVSGGSDAVAETGRYEVLDAVGASLDKGKFMMIWKQEDGKWKMHRDEWNSDLPMPTGK